MASDQPASPKQRSQNCGNQSEQPTKWPACPPSSRCGLPLPVVNSLLLLGLAFMCTLELSTNCMRDIMGSPGIAVHFTGTEALLTRGGSPVVYCAHADALPGASIKCNIEWSSEWPIQSYTWAALMQPSNDECPPNLGDSPKNWQTMSCIGFFSSIS